MARGTVKRVLDSDDDVEMLEPATNKHQFDTQLRDYPTPTSEKDQESQNNYSTKLSKAAFESVSKVSDEPRKLLTAINEIESLGIQQNLDLPKIVAIGDQSAGKSSAIAAISGITVPRKAGLCTRCPTHINLRVDSIWKCIVSLERRFQVKQKNEWERLNNPIVNHFADVEDLAQLEVVLVRAQAAILNPSADYRDYASGSIETDSVQIEFSPNLIRLDIAGPDCPELTFYDLPGVFNQTSKKEHQHLPRQIKKLVQEYIQSKNHILLLACPMDADAENSSAGSMINQNADAKKRCIGLLTKPDRLPEGNPIDSWKSILKGEAYKLEYGYFVTKQPSQKDLNAGIEYKQARQEEAEFFSQKEPWATEFADFHNQFGTEKLQVKLSQVLVTQIHGKIPSLIEKIDLDLNQCEAQLSQLPAPPRDAVTTVVRILANLEHQLKSVMEGELPHNAFILSWMRLGDAFAKAIHEVRPTLGPTSKDERKRGKIAMEKYESKANPTKPINLDDDDDEDEADQKEDMMTGLKRSGSSFTPSPSKRARASSLPRSDSPGLTNKFSLEDIREVRLSKNTSAIGSVDHRADEHIIMHTVKAWNKPLETFVAESRQALENELTGILDEQLANWHGTALYHELVKYALEFVLGASKRVYEFGERIVVAEAIKPMTVNLESKQQQDIQETSTLRSARRKYRARLWFDEEQARCDKTINKQQRESQMAKDAFDTQLGPDPWDKEIEIMGRVRGYYNVASASFVDTVCKVMRYDMFQRCQQNLIKGIETNFKLRDSDSNEAKIECERLLAEDDDRSKQRLFLEQEKEKYKKAKMSLEKVIG